MKHEPCPFCVSLDVPEPKRSSHMESECRYKSGEWEWKTQKKDGAPAKPQPQAAITNPQEENVATQEAAHTVQSEAARENAVRLVCDYLQDEFPEEMSVGSNNATTSQISGRISAIRHNVRKRREEAIAEEREDSEDKEENQPEWTTVDPDGVQVMSSSDEDDEETEEEEDVPDPSVIPDLSDSENSDDSDQDGFAVDHDLGRSSPEHPENDDTEETETDS